MTLCEYLDAAEGSIATVCGWGPDVIDEMTIPRFERMCHDWAPDPPVHELAAAYLQYKLPIRRSALSQKAPQPAGRVVGDTPIDFGVLVGMATGGSLSMAKFSDQ